VPQIAELGECGRLRALRFFNTLNAHLAERDYIATDHFTLARYTSVVLLDLARVIRLKPNESSPHLLRWRAAMAARPGVSA